MIETPIVNPRNKMAMKWYGGSQATSWIHGDGLLYEVSRGFTLFDHHFFCGESQRYAGIFKR